MNGDKLILNSDDIGIINSSFDKLISLKMQISLFLK